MNSRFIYVWLTLTLFLCLFPVSTFADTSLSGTINADRILTISESPYSVFGALNIPVGVTLSVDPGVIVKFGFNGAFVVSGKLDVNGTTENKVNFTSWSDDSLGGDSNGDGNATGPSAWNGVMFLPGSIGNISNLIIQYGGQYNQNSGWSEISNSGTLTITNSLFKNITAGFGLRQGAGTTTVIGTEFADGPQQMFVEGGVADIKGSYFHNSNGQALWMQNATVNLEDSTFDSHMGDTVVAQFPTTFTHKNNIFSNNRLNGFSIGGSVKSDAVLSNENIPYLVYGLSVDEGVTLSIDSGSMLKFYFPRGLQVLGTLNVNGSDTEPVYFTSINDDSIGGDSNGDGNTTLPQPLDWQSIAVSPGGIINMNYADVAYGGQQGYFSSPLPVIGNNNGTVVLNSVTIHDNITGFYQISGTGSIENSTFTKNDMAVVFDSGSLKIDGTNIAGNDFGITTALSAASNVDARNNWWGDASGPNNTLLNPSGTGDGIGDKVDFIPWLTSNPFATSTATTTPARTPVLIVPGVLGTEIFKGSEKLWLDLGRNFTDIGDQFMDPLQFNTDLTPIDTNLTIGDVIRKATVTILGFEPKLFDYTASLLEEFQNEGYIEGIDLFFFPYDWRYGVNENNIDKLQQKIQDIKTQTGSGEVDVVAHSTGGLLVKKYVMDHPGDNNIDKAVFVGVPNTGAPKAIKVLLQGDGFGIPWLADAEMKKIAKNLPVVYDLSPSQQYFDIKGSYVKIINQGLFSSTSQDLDFNEVNSFLINDHQLNSQAVANSKTLHSVSFDDYDLRTAGVDLYSIAGCKAGTIGKVVERRINGLLSDSIEYEIKEVPGDGTVPLESATNLPVDFLHKYYALRADHGKMPSQDGIRQQIVNIISGSSLPIPVNFSGNKIVTNDISLCKLNGKAIAVFSPLDIDITDQDGNHAGLIAGAIENNIPNASFEIMGEHKFVYLPDDEGQIYTIELKGTGDGTFTLKSQNISDNQITQTEVFSNIPVTTALTGNVNLGTTTTLSVNNVNDPIQPSSTINSDQSQDLIAPISTSTIFGTVGQPNSYRSNVSISLSAIDPVIVGEENQTSGILRTSYNLDNVGYVTYTSPVVISSEGQHTLNLFSTDNAGNNETEQSITFTIDKIAPELQVTFNINTKDVIFSAKDNLDQNPTIITTNTSITLKDNTGNTTVIPFKRLRELPTRLRLTYDKITRNGITTTIPKTSIVYDWQEKKGVLTDLDTKATIKGLEKYIFNYKKAKNVAIIKEKTNSGITTTTKPGFVVVTITTEGDGLKVDY